MTIKEGLNLKGAPARIPDAIREDLPQFFVDMGFKVGAEIGTAKGLFAKAICEKGLKLYAIDPWIDYPDYDKGNGFRGELENQYERAKKLLAPYDCVILKKTSMEALTDIPDGSLDFVYIDGNHGYKYVTEDIFEWSKKIRKGGIISGHDYIYTDRPFDNIHVKYVVDSYTKAFGIKNWYILGNDRIGKHKDVKLGEKVVIMVNEQGERRNKYRSWLWQI